MERPVTMVGHGVLIGILSYIIMLYLLKQKQPVSEKNAILLGSLSIAYMVQYGHKLPNFLN